MARFKLNAKCVLLDIEGTVSDIRFVYDVMFPFARDRMRAFLDEHFQNADVRRAIEQIAIDANYASADDWLGDHWRSSAHSTIAESPVDVVDGHLKDLMSNDNKSTGLKQMQGLVWKTGFESGQLRAELFPDVLPALQKWSQSELDIRIYSSGSVLAQQLFFSHTTQGDLSGYISAHYDTTIGPKKEPASYERIAAASQLKPNEILFATDVCSEIVAAEQAGMQVVASVRPNNVALPSDFTGLAISNFDELDIAR